MCVGGWVWRFFFWGVSAFKNDYCMEEMNIDGCIIWLHSCASCLQNFMFAHTDVLNFTRLSTIPNSLGGLLNCLFHIQMSLWQIIIKSLGKHIVLLAIKRQ